MSETPAQTSVHPTDPPALEDETLMPALPKERILQAGHDLQRELEDVRQLVIAAADTSDGLDAIKLGRRLDDVARRIKRIGHAAAHEIGDATNDEYAADQRREWWREDGCPMRCANCDGHITADDVENNEWQICLGLAEHAGCHELTVEDHNSYRSAVIEVAEDDAYQDDRARFGPQVGDRVRLDYADTARTADEGTWILTPPPDDPNAVGLVGALELDDGSIVHTGRWQDVDRSGTTRILVDVADDTYDYDAVEFADLAADQGYERDDVDAL